MLTWKTYNGYADNGTGKKPYGEGSCLSTDTKPVGMANGSTLMEMDTGKVYMYDEAGEQWRVFA